MPEVKKEPKVGVADFSVEPVDGAKALLKLGSEERLVDQADLHRVSKAVAAGVQFTY